MFTRSRVDAIDFLEVDISGTQWSSTYFALHSSFASKVCSNPFQGLFDGSYNNSLVISDSIMNKQYKPLIPFIIAIIIVTAFFVIPRGSALTGVLAQRYNIIRDHGYTISETSFTLFIYYTERSECNVTEYEEPNDWDVFHMTGTYFTLNLPHRWITSRIEHGFVTSTTNPKITARSFTSKLKPVNITK
jgi:hypothetical protein